MTEELKMLHTADIIPHPNNPRKDLGDIEELTESIKKNGIMQNLTVIPSEGGKYMALIGHRRLAAAKAAGLDLVPAKIIEGLSEREQVGIMLEENMQRNDLTPIEQAEGFQMMLDLGETEESIAEKTGFSRTTVRHRLEIAKLDKRILKKKASEDDGFQLTLSDLMALEQIDSIATRNAILDSADNSDNLRWKIKSEIASAKREAGKKAIVERLEAAGIQELPQKMSHKIYENDFKREKDFDKEGGDPGEYEPPKLKDGEKLYYYSTWNSVTVYRKTKKEKIEVSEQEKEFKARKRHLEELMKQYKASREEFIKGMLTKGLRKPPKEDIGIILGYAMKQGIFIGDKKVVKLMTGQEEYQLSEEERVETLLKVGSLGMPERILACIESSQYEYTVPWHTYNLTYKEDTAEMMMEYEDILELYGFSIDDEIQQVLDGMHEFYERI